MLCTTLTCLVRNLRSEHIYYKSAPCMLHHFGTVDGEERIPIPFMGLFFLFLIYFSDTFQCNLEVMGLNGGGYRK